MFSSLAKIPVIFLVTFAYRIAYTPPRPLGGTPKSELRPTSGLDAILGRWRSFHLNIIRRTQTVLGVTEMALILYASAPKWHWQPISRLSSAIVHVDHLQLTPMAIVGATLILASTLLRVYIYGMLGRFFQYEVSIQKDHELITSGPYSYVRHPSYSCLLLAAIGWMCWNGASGSLLRDTYLWNTIIGKVMIIAYTIYGIWMPVIQIFSRMSKEDEALRSKFGAKWDIWAHQVSYSVVPGIY